MKFAAVPPGARKASGLAERHFMNENVTPQVPRMGRNYGFELCLGSPLHISFGGLSSIVGRKARPALSSVRSAIFIARVALKVVGAPKERHKHFAPSELEIRRRSRAIDISCLTARCQPPALWNDGPAM